MKTTPLILTTVLLLTPVITGLQAQENAPTPDNASGRSQLETAAREQTAGANQEIRLNFRNARLEQVLEYLSEAAGFTIVLETQIQGTIDVWSNRPVSVQEAVDILDAALMRNGYAAIRDGKKLTVVDKDSAGRRNIPVIQSSDWESIPNSDSIATYIIPVRYIGAEQLMASLEQLKPEDMKITANADSNSLLITDSHSAIRRVVRIASLLDSSVSGVTTMRIIPLKHTDAAELAKTINELYSENTSNNRQSSRFGRGR